MKYTVVGMGEVGQIYAAALIESGVSPEDLWLVDPSPREEARDLAAAMGRQIEAGPGDWIGGVDRVWVCVTGELAPVVCAGLLPYMKPDSLLVDLSTAAPGDKRLMAQDATQSGVEYVDAVIMGAVGLTRERTALLLAGPQAALAANDLEKIGAPCRCLEDARPGDAATLKLLRTVLTKSLEALAVEAFVAAEQQGVRDELYAVLDDINQAGFTTFLDAIVTSHVLHAERRGKEVDRAAEQLRELGLPSGVLEGSKERFHKTTQARALNEPKPEATRDPDHAVQWLLDNSVTA